MVVFNALGLTISLDQLWERAAPLREQLGATAIEQSLVSQGKYEHGAMHLTESVVWCPKMEEILQTVEDMFPPSGGGQSGSRPNTPTTTDGPSSNTSDSGRFATLRTVRDKAQIQDNKSKALEPHQPSESTTTTTTTPTGPTRRRRPSITRLRPGDKLYRPQTDTATPPLIIPGGSTPIPPAPISPPPSPRTQSRQFRMPERVRPLRLCTSDLARKRDDSDNDDDDSMTVDATRAGYELAQFLRARGFAAMHVLPNLWPPLPDVGSRATTVLVKLAASVVYNAVDLAASAQTAGSRGSGARPSSPPPPARPSSSSRGPPSPSASRPPSRAASVSTSTAPPSPLARMFSWPAAATFSAAGRALSEGRFQALARGDRSSFAAALDMLEHLPRLGVAPRLCRGIIIVVDALDTAECVGDSDATDRVRIFEAALRRLCERERALLVFTLSNDDSIVGQGASGCVPR